MIRLLAIGAAGAIVFDVLQALLYSRYIMAQTWVPQLELALFAAFGFFLVRLRFGAVKSMAAVVVAALAEVGIGWWLAGFIVYGPAVFEPPKPIPTPTPGPPGFSAPDEYHVVLYGAPLPPLYVSMTVAVLHSSAAGAAGIVLATFVRRLRRT